MAQAPGLGHAGRRRIGRLGRAPPQYGSAAKNAIKRQDSCRGEKPGCPVKRYEGVKQISAVRMAISRRPFRKIGAPPALFSTKEAGIRTRTAEYGHDSAL